MIQYEEFKIEDVLDALESLAYKVARYEHPTWISIPEEEIERILTEEGLVVYIE